MAAGNTLDIQSILDAVVPNVLPLVAVFGIYMILMGAVLMFIQAATNKQN